MGSGERHGRHRARHAHRHRRTHRHHQHHQHHHNHHGANVTHAHHHPNHFQGHLFWGAAGRRRAQAASNTPPNNASHTNTFVGFYATSTRSSTSPPPPSPSTVRYFSMCRVFSIFLWFVGIMMMSLGGFKTPIGFIGLGMLFFGVIFLIFTSMMMSGSCSNHCFGTTDPEQPSSSDETITHRNNITNPHGQSPGFTPAFGTFYGDPSPAYASPDLSADKPPSYEEVMDGRYPPTVSGTILATIPEGAAPTLIPPSAELPTNDTSVPPYPSNTLQAQTLGWSVAADNETGSGTNYTLDAAAYISSQVSDSTAPPEDVVIESGPQTDSTPQAPYYDTHSTESLNSLVQVVNQHSGDSIQPNVNLSSMQADASSQPIPSADSLSTVQVETFHDSPIPSMYSQTQQLPVGDQSMHLSSRTSVNNSTNAFSSHTMIESSSPVLEEEVGDTNGEAGIQDEHQSSSSSASCSYPDMSSTLTIITQSDC